MRFFVTKPDQLSMFDPPRKPQHAVKEIIGASEVRFNGSDYEPIRDDQRLSSQLLRVFDLMRDGDWRSLAAISMETGDPPASVSAQLRHLRKARFGSHTVEKRYLGDGLFEYRLIVNQRQECATR